MSTDSNNPKIIIDEDWKAQVEAEKEKARRPAAEPTATNPSPTQATTPAAEPPDELLPPASFAFLLTPLPTKAMIALGQIPNPITGKSDLRLNQAKHHID